LEFRVEGFSKSRKTKKSEKGEKLVTGPPTTKRVTMMLLCVLAERLE
jgi:hypothetical protein